MSTDLAILDDLILRIPGGLDTAEYDRAETALMDASAAVRNETGQYFTPATDTIWVRVKNGIIRLPQRPISAVTAVTDENGNALTFTWLDDDRVRLTSDALNAWELEPYRNPLGEVKVTYTHGSETVPDVVIAVVCSVAARALGRDPMEGSVIQEAIEGYSYGVGSVGAAGAMGLLPEEKLRLQAFTRPHAASYQGV